jgi:hypothetical protein
MSTEAGVKHDAGKAPVRKGVIEQFPRACMVLAEVSAFGADKYCWDGWKSVENGIQRYGDAAARHAIAAAMEGPVDSDSGLLHAAHEAWNVLARLELMLAPAKPATVAPVPSNVPFGPINPSAKRGCHGCN